MPLWSRIGDDVLNMLSWNEAMNSSRSCSVPSLLRFDGLAEVAREPEVMALSLFRRARPRFWLWLLDLLLPPLLFAADEFISLKIGRKNENAGFSNWFQMERTRLHLSKFNNKCQVLSSHWAEIKYENDHFWQRYALNQNNMHVDLSVFVYHIKCTK